MCVSAEPNEGQDEDSLPRERWQVTHFLEWNACSPWEHGCAWYSRWKPTADTGPYMDHYSSIPGVELLGFALWHCKSFASYDWVLQGYLQLIIMWLARLRQQIAAATAFEFCLTDHFFQVTLVIVCPQSDCCSSIFYRPVALPATWMHWKVSIVNIHVQ